MSETTTVEKKVVKPSGLKTWIIITAIVFPPIAYFLNLVMGSFGQQWIYPTIIPFPFIWNLFILYALTKLSPRLKLTPQELVLFFVICWLSAGSMYAAFGLSYWPPAELLMGGSMDYAIRGLAVGEPYTSIWMKYLPGIMAPKDPEVVKAFWYGGVFNLSAWIGPILFWILWLLAIHVGMTFWGYLLRKPLVETERLPFPGIAPTIYLLKYYTNESDGKPQLFNFKLNISKLFWLGFIVGMIIAIPGNLNTFMPLGSGANALTAYPIDLSPMLSGILPGALLGSTLYITDVMVGQFIPLDALLTAVLYWFVFGVVYQTVGVKTGILPYQPGWEGQYMSNIGPFLWARFAQVGIIGGLAFWVIVRYHKHMIDILKKGLLGEKGDDDGMPYSVIAYGAFGAYILQVILFAITGTPIIMAIIIPLVYIFFLYGWTRMMGEVEEFMPDTNTYTPIIFDIGTFLGQWGPRPSPGAFNTLVLYKAYGSGVDGDAGRMSAWHMHHFFKGYKMADEMNTSAKEVVIVGLITMASTTIFAAFVWPWFMTRFGGSSNIYQLEHASLGSIYAFTYGTPPGSGGVGFTVTVTWTYLILGIITVYIIYILRARYAWFFINPIGMVMLPWGWWSTWLIAFIIKYSVLKVGGSKFFEEKWIPFTVGFLMGFGAISLFGALVMFFGTALPTWLGRF